MQHELFPIAPEFPPPSKSLRTPAQPSTSSVPSQKTPAEPIRQVTFEPTPRAMIPLLKVQLQNGRRKSRSAPSSVPAAQPETSLRPTVNTPSDASTNALKGSSQPVMWVNPAAEPFLMTLTLRHLNAHIRERAERGLGQPKR